MPLTRTPIEIPMVGGIDQSSYKQAIQQGKLRTAKNVRYDKTGAVHKRLGHTQTVGNINLTDTNRNQVEPYLTGSERSLLVCQTEASTPCGQIAIYDGGTTLGTQSHSPRAFPTCTLSPIFGTTRTVTGQPAIGHLDISGDDSYVLSAFAYTNSSGTTTIAARLFLNDERFTPVSGGTASTTTSGAALGYAVRCLRLTNDINLIFYKDNGTTLHVFIWNSSTGATTSTTISTTGSVQWDVCKSSDGRYVYLGHVTAANSVTLQQYTADYSFSLVHTKAVSNANNVSKVAVGYDTTNSYLYVVYLDVVDALKYSILDGVNILTTITGAATIASPVNYTFGGASSLSIEQSFAGQAAIALSGRAASSGLYYHGFDAYSLGYSQGPRTLGRTFWHHNQSKPFYIDTFTGSGGSEKAGMIWARSGKAYDTGSNTPDYGPYTNGLLFVGSYDGTSTTILAQGSVLPEQVVASQQNPVQSVHAPVNIVRTTSTRGNTVIIHATRAESNSDGGETIYLIRTTFGRPSSSADFSNQLTIQGGANWVHDQVSSFETSLPYYPYKCSGTPNSGSGLLPSGLYRYIAVFLHTDSLGNVHRSTPSLPLSVTTTDPTTNYVDISIPVSKASNRDVVYVELYRTLVGGTGAFYRVTTILNTTGPYLTYQDGFHSSDLDAVIAANVSLYSSDTNGVVANVQPPTFTYICAHANRLWGLDPDGGTLWFTKLQVPNEPANWAYEFTQNIDAVDQATGMSSMDDKLVLFTTTAMFIVTGDGPNDAAVGNFNIQLVQSGGIGCVDPRSIVRTDAGIFFMSTRGLYLLDRALTLTFVGAEAQDQTLTNGQPNTFDFAYYHPVERTVHWGIRDPSLAYKGTRLVFDYKQGAWSVDDFPGGYAMYGLAYFDHRTWAAQGANTNFTSSLVKEDLTVNTDLGSWITVVIETSDIGLTGLAGFQRAYEVLILGERVGDTDITIDVAYDYDDTFTQTNAFTAGELSIQDAGDQRIRVYFNIQKCKAVRLRYTDAEPSAGMPDDAGGMTLTAMRFLLAAKNNMDKKRAFP